MPDNLKAMLQLNTLRFALGSGALYAALGCLWVIVSDSLVSSVSSDPAGVATALRYKELFYVFATSLGLIFLVRLGFKGCCRRPAVPRPLECVYGFTQAALMANPGLWLQAVHPDDVHIATASMAALQAKGEASCEYRRRSASGDAKWVF